MTRRVILATCLLATIGGAAGTALAEAPLKPKPHQICVVLVKSDNTTQDYCVDWTAVRPH
jgi:hypothetical protein